MRFFHSFLLFRMFESHSTITARVPSMPKTTTFRIGLVQMSMTTDPVMNLTRAMQFVEQAAQKGAQIICLPELFRSRYFCQREDVALFDLAEPVPGPTTEAIGVVAKKNHVAVVGPVFERAAAGLYFNSAVVMDSDGRQVGFYRKMHIPDDPSYYEKFYFAPGDTGFTVCDTAFGRIATLICWDQWFPEGARIAALQDASVILYPTAIGWHPHEKQRYGEAQCDAWRTVQRGHAIANGIYIAAVNRVGLEQPDSTVPGIEFWGSSFICDPQGVILAEASAEKEEILIADVDLTHLETVRRHWPFLRDRRIDRYEGILRRSLP
jgi:N-carbamoylputrescine amidase